MRRPSALILTLALVASALLAVASPSSAVIGTDDKSASGSLNPWNDATGSAYSPAPTSFEVGQVVKLQANFSGGPRPVSLYKVGSTTPIATETANSSGNTYFEYTVTSGSQQLFAEDNADLETETDTYTGFVPGPATPNGTVTGTLSESPSSFAYGDTIDVAANFPSGSFNITLYKEGPTDTWTSVGTLPSNSSGNATFKYVASSSAKLFARKSNNDRTEVDLVAPAPTATLSVRRDCTGNECGTTATAYGELKPAVAGRVFKLQWKNGSTWTQIGEGTTNAEGKVEIEFPVGSLPQWTIRNYRITSATDGVNPTTTSREIQFMPGPTQLGANVLRVDVDKGVYPTSKTTEHTGVATLSENGVTKHDHVALENFGVRGTSTANYEKRAYKLKFLDKPPKPTTVFGMPRGKSWSLLANWLDRSNVRDKVGLELGRKMNKIAWTPQSRYVEMFVNDQYRGAYLMTESVKIDGDRVDVDEAQGMIMETDGVGVDDSQLGFMSSKGIPFQFKDPDERKDGGADPTGVTSAKLAAIKKKVNEFEAKLYSSSTREQYPSFIDVPSALDFYLVKEFTKDRDADFYRSNYFTWDPSGGGKPLRDGKFHFGPAWDFDRSAGITSENDTIHKYVASPSGYYLRGTGIDNDHPNYKTQWFVQLTKSTSFKNLLHARWLEIRGEFEKASDIARASALEVGVGAENERKRWPGSRGKYAARGTYQGEIDYVANWYDKRFEWLDDNL